jgi:2-polyprenyl-6-hydroxyphenyl methylase/3-demethylubiquinone-9 3-methyltransferase
MQAMAPIVEQRAESKADHVQVADPRPVACKICGAPSPLLGVVDFHKSCIEAQGRRLAVSGHPVYYRRCPQCAFVFTNAFDAWDWDAFSEHIYNNDYIVVDPDYVEQRPAGNAHLIANSFSDAKGSIQILDYGGGTGVLAARLRDQGFSATTYDPFSSFNELPSQKFDLISCFEVLEHAPFPEKTVATMVSLLKDPGAILFSTLVQPAEFDSVGLNWWYASPRNGHVSLYSTQALALLFRPYGMRVGSFSPDLHIAYAQIPPFAARLKLPA